MDTKNELIAASEARRKLLAIKPHHRVPTAVEVKFVTTGSWKTDGTPDGKDGFSVWELGSGQQLRALPFDDLESLARALIPMAADDKETDLDD